MFSTPTAVQRNHEPRQAFYAGLRKPRELTHDSQVYRAYLRAEERLRSRDARIGRVVLDYELNLLNSTSSSCKSGTVAGPTARGGRTASRTELRPGQASTTCRCSMGVSTFPTPGSSTRIPERHVRHEDIEVVTEHYRGAHAAAAARSLDSGCYGIRITSITGSRGGGGNSAPKPSIDSKDFLG